ncbi:transcription termination factor Rho [Senegalimassilia anaerobia]|uniref:Transcription termination factor Rho n=1 Tax=Senegalimassilia anaerobia TaxID=1473216 RepID=A0A369LEZ1_9ACTN|nr:transcription termination factor Rho [Senegalimassilia anaerobia]RDB56715.1 transcription termination factor Rho [Senegalimassilia anaerobia]
MSDEQNVAEAPQQGAPAADAAPAAPKRRPGRPRKSAASSGKASSEASSDAASDAPVDGADSAPKTPAKRRPGRPRKKAAPAQKVESAPAAKADAAAKAEPAAKPVSAAKAKKAKEAPAEPEAAASKAQAAEAAQPAETVTGTPARRRPGRSHKKIATAPVAAQAASAQDASDKQQALEAAEAAGSDQQAPAKDMAPGRAARAARTPRKSVRAQGANREGRSEQHEGRGKSDAREGAERAEGRNSGNAGADRHQRNDRSDRNSRKNGNDRHQRHQRNNNREVVPSVNKDDLAKLKVAELRAKAAELDVDVAGLKKAELIDAVYDASLKAEGFVEVEGILDIMQDGYGFLRTNGYLPSEQDCYVGLSTIRRNGLRKGDKLTGTTRPARPNEKYAAVQKVATVNGKPVEELGRRVRFGDLTPVYPDECLTMEHGQTTITARVIDLVSPIGKGQRGLIVSPPKAGKTTILKDIAAAISANNPEVHLMCLLVDERPEEVTDMQRSIKGEVISSTFDMPTENHIQVSELVIERAKRLVEDGKDVVVLLDSLTRLARAYNLAQPASGRILSGGVDSTALYPPKKFLGAARNIEGGGSLTILASALVETGSKMDEVIFEEFKGTGNMELKLDRNLADRRIFPAIDPVASGTRKEDLLLDPQKAPLIWAVRRILANTNNTERAMDMLIKSLKRTDDNDEFLMRTAKKAQHNNGNANANLEF